MQHLMPHERPTAEDTGPIFDQAAAVPALCWALALGLIVASGWMEGAATGEPLAALAVSDAASQAAPAR